MVVWWNVIDVLVAGCTVLLALFVGNRMMLLWACSCLRSIEYTLAPVIEWLYLVYNVICAPPPISLV